MNRFLWEGGGFQAIVNLFRWPIAQTWSGTLCRHGSAGMGDARFATRHRVVIGHEDDLAQAALEAVTEVERFAARSDVCLAVWGIDPRSWERVVFALWSETPEASTKSERYEVLIYRRRASTCSQLHKNPGRRIARVSAKTFFTETKHINVTRQPRKRRLRSRQSAR
ncbi:hypothetical protein BPMI_02140 [Candidatus Burkholderia pumila]|uniref:Uncharacterized protein n=1 Tax=Candidatus Burkholderia pumila TaxID=1090375 RepID=A0ABR5HP10_9BURK|nr:hypothetical protein BPMI_02140 [Candidatus Burkholderia pumila]